MLQSLKIKDAYFFEASVNYTILHFQDGSKEMHAYTLKRFEELLSSDTAFVRIHKSFLVNKQYIAEVNPANVVMYSGVVLPLARRRRV